MFPDSRESILRVKEYRIEFAFTGKSGLNLGAKVCNCQFRVDLRFLEPYCCECTKFIDSRYHDDVLRQIYGMLGGRSQISPL